MATPSSDSEPSSSVPSTPSQATTDESLTFGLDGDLRLIVGTTMPKEMLVDSQALCQASSVFRTMLSNRFSEAKPEEGEWKVELPEDDPDAFADLMGMIHDEHDRPSFEPTITRIYGVCILTDKYDMAHVLRPIKRSMAELISRALRRSSHGSALHLLLIAWETGNREAFTTLLMRIILSSTTSEEDGSFLCEDQGLENHKAIEVCGAYDTIVECRDSILKAVFRKYNDTLLQLVNDTDLEEFCDENECPWEKKVSTTNVAVLGTFMQHSFTLGILDHFYLLDPSPFSGSINDMESCLNEVKEARRICRCGGPVTQILADMAEKRDEQATWLLADDQEEHLRIQAAKFEPPRHLHDIDML
ncbi:hypothetical protein EDB81DRAFT_903807 [Dactylonectria macrodidyma]|uniref:BTB domain-containing protein n=1 Tax=Dactylonectria macrodidyma TaxID=307937 RepID=A0A9P9EAN8_9HYPO|nr:hypothetical protein EDB81DRAFT_903807 [Dactylonectria macrodidyma]